MTTTAAAKPSTPTPERFMQMANGAAATQLLATAIELDLFTHIHKGTHTLEALASAVGASPRGTRIIVDALVGVGLLTRQDGVLGLAPDAAMYLSRDSRAFIGGMLKPTLMGWADWGRLAEAVRSGTSPVPRGDAGSQEAFFSEWVDSLFNLNYAAAQTVAEKLAAGAHAALDIGAGSAVWSTASAQRNQDLRVTALDFTAVLDKVTRPMTQRMGVADRYTYRADDLRHADLGENAFDLIFVGHILHGAGARDSADLLRRCHRALRPGGTVVVAEMVPDDERSKNVHALMFALTMLVFTPEGDTFSTSQLEAMAREAGFTSLDWLEAPAPSPLLLARKA